MTKPDKTKEELALTIDEAEWQWVRPHLERGTLIVVAPGLELAEAGYRIAEDNTPMVTQWIQNGKLGKPTTAQVEAWNATPSRRFQMLIVSPYILLKEAAGKLYSA